MAVTEWSIPFAHLHGEQRPNRPIKVLDFFRRAGDERAGGQEAVEV